MGVSGTGIAITGSNFDIAQNDRISFNASSSAPNGSATTTQINTSVPASTGSGRISVTTPAGTATSAQDFYIPFGAHAVGDIGYTGRIAFGGTQTVSLSSGKIGLLLFDGTPGQGISLQFSGSTFSTCTLYLYSPNRAQVASTSCTSATAYLASTTLASTGTYTIGIDAGTSSGSIAIGLTTDVLGSITPGTPLNLAITAGGQGARYTFHGTAGQVVSAEVAGFGGGVFSVNLLNQDGTILASTNGSNQVSIVGKTLARASTYTIWIASNGATGSATVSLISQTTNGTIMFGTPVTSTISSSSLIGLNFSGTAGQVVSLEAAGFGSGFFWTYLLNPDGSVLASTDGTSQESITGKTLATTGTYQIVIIPNNGVTGSVTVSLVSQTTNGTITFGTPVTSAISSSSLIGLNFSGTAGQVVSLEAAGLSGNFWLILLNPNGSQLASTFSSGTLNLVGKTLATTGTYQVVIIPNNGVTGSVTVSLVSQTTNGTITFGTPVTSTISSSSLIGLNFSGTAGQVVSLEAAGLSGNFWLILLNPNGSQLASTFSSGALNLVGKTLATTGTYQVVIIPNNGVTGSVTVSLVSQTTNGTIMFGTPVTSTISTSSLIGLSFSGTAGQIVSVQITPSFSGGGFSAYLLNPNGSTLASTFSTTSVTFSGKTLGSTGTYQIVIAPNKGVTGSATTSLTSP
jgi:hypothetical protein